MTLYQKLQQDLKTAMLARDELTRDTIRMVIAAIKKWEIDTAREAGDAEVLGALQTAAKTRLESIEHFEKAGREDLAAKERAEIAIVGRYLPEQLNEDQARALVARLISELGLTGKKDLGALMKAVMARHKGEVDGKLIQRIAAEILP